MKAILDNNTLTIKNDNDKLVSIVNYTNMTKNKEWEGLLSFFYFGSYVGLIDTNEIELIDKRKPKL